MKNESGYLSQEKPRETWMQRLLRRFFLFRCKHHKLGEGEDDQPPGTTALMSDEELSLSNNNSVSGYLAELENGSNSTSSSREGASRETKKRSMKQKKQRKRFTLRSFLSRKILRKIFRRSAEKAKKHDAEGLVESDEESAMPMRSPAFTKPGIFQLSSRQNSSFQRISTADPDESKDDGSYASGYSLYPKALRVDSMPTGPPSETGTPQSFDRSFLAISFDEDGAQLVIQSSNSSIAFDEFLYEESPLGATFPHPVASPFGSSSSSSSEESSPLGVDQGHPHWIQNRDSKSSDIWASVMSEPMDGNVTDPPSPMEIEKKTTNWGRGMEWSSSEDDPPKNSEMDAFGGRASFKRMLTSKSSFSSFGGNGFSFEEDENVEVTNEDDGFGQAFITIQRNPTDPYHFQRHSTDSFHSMPTTLDA